MLSECSFLRTMGLYKIGVRVRLKFCRIFENDSLTRILLKIRMKDLKRKKRKKKK